MSLLSNLGTDASIKGETDSVGGGFGPLDSGLYKAKVTMAYVKAAASGAVGLFLTMKTEDDKEIRQTVYMTAGTAKGGNNYYEKDGVKSYLPGFLTANSLALLTVGKEIGTLDTETKVVKVYSSEAKSEVPTKVEAIVDLIGQDIIVGLIKQTVDKNTKVGNEYVATGETREENEIDKLFRAEDRMTVAEISAQAEVATFADSWDSKWAGKIRNKAKGAAAGGTAGVPGAAKTAGAPKKSLFAKAE